MSAIAATDNYRDAEAIVDRLADDGFPVQHVSIVGRDLQYASEWWRCWQTSLRILPPV